jgi:HAD superfamily hydrolase (TIGR01549 family)
MVAGGDPVSSALETLFLDAGGVIVQPNWERVSAALARRGIRVQAAALEAADPHARRRLDAPGTVASSTDRSRGWLYMDLVLERAGVGPGPGAAEALAEIHAYHAEHNLWERLCSGAREGLERLAALPPKRVVVSNANGRLHAMLERLDLARYFDLALDSHDEGVEKPDPRLFQIAMERSGGRPETTVHVGDLYSVDVVGARRAGVEGWLIDPLGLYPEADCPRFPTLVEVAAEVERRIAP